MKEIVLKLEKTHLRFDEERFNLFLVKPLFLLFIYFGVYSRFSGFPGLTGGLTTVVISFGLFFLAVIHILFIKQSMKLSNFSSLIVVFFVLSGVVPFLSIFVFGSEPLRILRYSTEIAVNFFMFFSTYYFVREKIITPKFFIYSFAILAFIASLSYLRVMFQSASIFRLTGLGGLNTLGNSFALGIFAWIMILYINSHKKLSTFKKYGSYFCVLLLFLSMLFTGTRSAIIALLVGLGMFQLLGMKSKSFKKYFIISVVAIICALIIIALNFDLTNWWGRFSTESIMRMASIRFTIYFNSVADLTLADFLFGRPDFYVFSNEADDFINPHNLFLAAIRYNGIVLFILLVFIFMALFYKYYLIYRKHRRQKKYRVVETSIIIFFVMVVIYTMFSGGRITRSFNFFMTLGYAVGYFEMFKNLKSCKEYDDAII